MKSNLGSLREIIGDAAAPIVDCLPVPEPLLYRCEHGLLPGYVAPRLIGPLIEEDNDRGTQIWTPEHGVTFFKRPCLYRELVLRLGDRCRIEPRPAKPAGSAGMWACRYDERLDGRDDLELAVDESFDSLHRRFRTSTAVILPQRPVCVQCDRDYRDKRRARWSKAETLTQPMIDRRPMPKPDVPKPGDISFLPLSLEQCEAAKAKRVMLPGLRNGRSVRVREAWEIAADNAEWTAKNNRKLTARGWVGYSPEAFDREILVSRGSVTAEAVKKFDRDLSRKGNKYRIQ
jgi:hypothetical protein